MKLFKNHTVQQLGFSFGGQICFLITNFILFIYLIKGFDQSEYGSWALFITLVSIVDGVRQGFVQNGFITQYIQAKDKSRLVASAFTLNMALMALLAVALYALCYIWISLPTETVFLLKNAWKSLLSIGLLQFYNSYFHAQKNQLKYLLNNAIYLLSFVVTLICWTNIAPIGFEQILNIQLIIIIPSTLHYIYQSGLPLKSNYTDLSALCRFGKYAAGTNLSSLLFHKVDILMIGFFMDPIAVAIYHLTVKVMAYAEIPMQAISQFIYPKLADGLHRFGVSHLNIMYSRSVILLLVFVIPLSLILTVFRDSIVILLSNSEYLDASDLILCFSFAMLFKPWGRMFGLSLDALNKPQVNLLMLLFSLSINITLNLIMIPKYGIIGGAIATMLSIISTVIIGQIVLYRTQGINPLKEAYHFTKNIKKHGLSWN